MNEKISNKLPRLRKISFAVGFLFLVFACIGWMIEPREFFISYLWSFIFWIGLSLGCFNVALIYYLTGGRWGFVARRFLEAGFMTLPLMAILFVPILFGLHELYPWARASEVAASKILQQKAAYENVPGFVIRAICFFGIWIFIAAKLRKWSLQQDAENNLNALIKLKTLSGPAIVIVPLTVTFAFIDWVMSIEPAWFSTVFCVILLSGQILVAFSFGTILLARFQTQTPFCEIITPPHFRDLGNLILAFVLFWTYVVFSQLLIVYSGNLPQEIDWYLRRIAGDWKWLIILIAAFHFFVPFFLLLFRPLKENARSLFAVAVLIFFTHVLEIFWVIAPTFYPADIKIHWTDFATWIGLGGIWLGTFFGNLQRHPLLAKEIPSVINPISRSANAK